MTAFANLTTKQKIYLSLGVFSALLFLIIFLVVAPVVSQIRNDGLELVQKKQNMELFYSDWRLLDKSHKDYQAMRAEIGGLPALLPKEEPLKFIVLIENIAQATGLRQEVSVIPAPNDNKNAAVKNSLDFQIILRGRFPNLIKFLVYLENAPYYSNLKSLQIQRLSAKDASGASVSSGEISATLKVNVFQ